MADIYLHSKMAQEIRTSLSQTLDQNTLFLGAQSSDPMYYAVFHKNGRQYRYYADRMHDTDTQKLLIDMTDYVKQNNSIYTYSYLIGFVCHYSLDVTLHPYVYHHAGVYDKNNPDTHPHQGLHLKFERSIDCALMEKDTSKPSRFMNLTRYHFPSKKVHPDVLDLMKNTFQKQFSVSDGDAIFQTSVRHMYNIIRYMTTDRYGIKKLFYKLFDLFRGNRDLFMADMSLYHHVENYDFLNETHRQWQHPVTGEVFTSSVHELYHQAIEFAHELIVSVDKYIAGDNIDLKTVFTNLSFNSGVDCNHSHPFQYTKPYRP